jgi:rRNA maturation endonuclease Nob1
MKEFDPTLLGFELFEQYLEDGEMLKRCNDCNEVFDFDSVICDFCGSDDFKNEKILI